MSLSRNKVPLGAVLQQAGLVSAEDIKQALQQQSKEGKNRRIGDILAARGQIDPITADFFVDDWSGIVKTKPKQPIGQYFKQAALLNEKQIQTILDEQKQSKLRFGELAIAKGWLKPTTVDFFLRYLTREPAIFQQNKSNEIKSAQQIHESFYKIKLKLLNLEDREAYSEEVFKRVLFWTGGQSFLTQKLISLISEHHTSPPLNQEAEVDYLVQTKFLQDWRDREIGFHLEAIENRLLNNQQVKADRLLRLYRQILSKPVAIDRSPEQRELLKTGLVVKQQECLVVANRIYQFVFNPGWIENRSSSVSHQDDADSIEMVNSVSKTAIQAKNPNRSFQFKNLLLLLALISLLLVFVNNISRRIKVRTAFKKGNEFLKQKSFSEAIDQYNKLLNIDSNYFQAWTNRGYALAGLQRYNEMRESCSTATIINSAAVYAWNCQGEALHNLQREEEAILSFDKAISLDKSDPIFLINKSESLKAIGKHEESLVTIEQAIEVLSQIEAIKGTDSVKSEFAIALTFLGNGYRRKQQYESALTSYNRALDYSANYFPAQIGKGIVLKRMERYQEARNEFNRILNNQELSEAKKAQTWFYLGQTLCTIDRKPASIAAFERAIELQPNYQAAQQAKQQCS